MATPEEILADTMRRLKGATAPPAEGKAKPKADQTIDDTIRRAQDVIRGKMDGTAIQEEPGMIRQGLNAIGRFFGEVPEAGDLDQKLGQADDITAAMGYNPASAIASLTTGIHGVVDTLANRDARTGDTTGLTTAATAVTDTMSIGTKDKTGAMIDTAFGNRPRPTSEDGVEVLSELWQQETGGDMPTYLEQLERRELEQEEIRAANPMTALAGDVLGATITGATLAKGAFSMASRGTGFVANALTGSAFRRLLFGSVIGGAETMAYSLNKDGDLKEAAIDGTVSLLGGMVLGGFFAGVKGGYKRITGKRSNDAVQAAVGESFLDMINNVERKAMGLPPATAAEIAEEVAALGPTATVMDAYPKLREFANGFIAIDGSKGNAAALYDLMSTRSSFMKDLMDETGHLRSAFSAKGVRSFDTVSRSVKERFKVLQPRFTEIYDANKNLRFSAKQITSNVKTLFGPNNRWSPDQIDLVNALKDQISAFKKQTAIGNKTKKLSDSLTLEQTVKLKQWLQDSIGAKVAKVAGKDAPIPLTNTSIRNFTMAQELIGDMVEDLVPDLKPLNAVYGNLSSLKTAYKAGQKAFTSTAKDSADVAAFLADKHSAAAKRLFVEGARFDLFKKLDAAKTIDQVDTILNDNRVMLRKMEAMFGKGATAEMINNVTGMVKQVKTATALRKAFDAPKVSNVNLDSGVNLKKMLDEGIATAMVPGLSSVAGGLGAMGRLFNSGPNQAAVDATTKFGSEALTRTGSAVSDVFTQLQDMVRRSALPSQGYQSVLPGGVAAGIGGGINSASSAE